MSSLVYPLHQVLEVKQNRVKDQERVVVQKKEALEVEKKKLEEAKQARQKVQDHYNDKMSQLREKMDTGGTSPDFQQMKNYLKVVQGKLVEEDKKVAAQQEQVKKAEKAVEEAQELLKTRRREVDKLETHRKDWMREMRLELEQQEAGEQDEMGSIIYLNKMRSRG